MAEESDNDYDDRYMDDAACRLRHGPSIDKWGDFGLDESLIGLKIVFDFPQGSCTGTVRSCAKSYHSDDSVFDVAWICGASTEEYFSELTADDCVSWHFHNRQRPDWMKEEKYERGAKTRHLFDTDPAQELTNFQLPNEAGSLFPWIESERGNRWWVTIACLNDPSCASQYDPSGKLAYPLPLLLTIIVLCKDLDPSTKLPILKSAEKERVFKQADVMARQLANNRGPEMGYGELATLEQLVKGLQGHAKKCTTTSGSISKRDWDLAYEYCESLILTLSEDFEEANTSWHFADDPERIRQACASLVEALEAVLLHPPPYNEAQELLSKDRAHISNHLQAGTFVTFVETEEFEEEFPHAAAMWKKLMGFGGAASSTEA